MRVREGVEGRVSNCGMRHALPGNLQRFVARENYDFFRFGKISLS